MKFQKTHGLRFTKEYKIWLSMCNRCSNPNNPNYKNYGGRGIKVCNRWKSGFLPFLEDMGNAPSLKHSIDRIDNNGNYEPSNCRWTTNDVQQNNKSNNLILTFHGESKTFSQWCDELGLIKPTVYNRLKRGWSVDDALTKPTDIRCRRKPYTDLMEQLRKWLDMHGIQSMTQQV